MEETEGHISNELSTNDTCTEKEKISFNTDLASTATINISGESRSSPKKEWNRELEEIVLYEYRYRGGLRGARRLFDVFFKGAHGNSGSAMSGWSKLVNAKLQEFEGESEQSRDQYDITSCFRGGQLGSDAHFQAIIRSEFSLNYEVPSFGPGDSGGERDENKF